MIGLTGKECRVLVWRNGINDTDHGPLVWSERSRKEVMSTYKKRGNLLLIDINHNYNEEERRKWEVSGEPAPTAGYASLELAADGSLWMVPQWSAFALDKIGGRELRYVSPDFSYDEKTRELLDIYRISLVAEPGTWGARLVASAKRRGKSSMGISPELLAKLMELAQAMEAEGVSDALKTKIAEVVGMVSGGEAVPVDKPDDVMAGDPKDKAPPLAQVSAFTSIAARHARERADVEARGLCGALRDEARRELKTTPAEEMALGEYKDPDQLKKALALLSASRGAKAAKADPVKEPTQEQKQAPGKYTGALSRAGIYTGGAQ